MPFAIRDLGDGRLLIVGAVPGDGLLAAVNALRGDLEHAIIVDRGELTDALKEPQKNLGGWERVGEPQPQGEADQEALPAHVDEAERRKQILGF